MQSFTYTKNPQVELGEGEARQKSDNRRRSRRARDAGGFGKLEEYSAL